jgi:hypothetical protein
MREMHLPKLRECLVRRCSTGNTLMPKKCTSTAMPDVTGFKDEGYSRETTGRYLAILINEK